MGFFDGSTYISTYNVESTAAAAPPPAPLGFYLILESVAGVDT